MRLRDRVSDSRIGLVGGGVRVGSCGCGEEYEGVSRTEVEEMKVKTLGRPMVQRLMQEIVELTLVGLR